MAFGWKVLIPINLVWILVVATIRALRGPRLARSTTRWPAGRRARSAIAAGASLGIAGAERSDRPRPPPSRAGRADEDDERAPAGRRRLPDAAAGPGRARPAADAGRRRRRPAERPPGATGSGDSDGSSERVDRCLTSSAPPRASASPSRRCSRRSYTEQYPEDKRPTAPRFHGRHVLNRHPDGLEKCVGCELCAWACPADAIYVEGGDNTEEERYSPGERYGKVYQINYLRCIFCGLCIEACPTRSLTMTNEYELADDNRQELIYTKEQLLAPLLPGMEAPPHAMRLGDDEKDYYTVESPGRRCSRASRRAPANVAGRPITGASGRRRLSQPGGTDAPAGRSMRA